jgi:hypothetical protein
MNETRRWLVTIGAALLALAICVGVVWLVAPWDLATRVAVGTSAGVVVGAIIALWGARAVDRVADVDRVGKHPSELARNRRVQRLTRVNGALVIQSGGDLHFGSSSITVGPQSAPVGPGDMTAIVTAFHGSPPSRGWTMNSPIRHEGSLASGRLEIRPVHPYLDLVNSGEELTLLKFGRDAWIKNAQAAQLDIKVVNNTNETVVIHQVCLDVAKSISRLESVPFIQEGKVELDPDLEITYPFVFAGDWPASGMPGQWSVVTLRFHLEHPKRSGPLTSQYSWEAPHLHGPSERAKEDHPLVRALAEAGASPEDDEESARRIYKSSRSRGNFHSRVWEVGPFDDGRALIVGVMSYADAGADGTERSFSYPFRAPLSLTTYYRVPLPTGAMGSSAAYVAPVLKSDGTDYAVEIPVSHSLASGEADRLLLALPAPCPSTHDFNVRLLCSIGSVDGGTVRLETFRTLKG